MSIFDKSTIENFATKASDEVVNNSLSHLSLIIENAMSEISKKNAFITTNFELLPVNEFASGAILPNSKLKVLLVLESPQLELNTASLIKNKWKAFWIRIKNAWQSRKKRKKDKYINSISQQLNKISKENYNIPTFLLDLVNSISHFITSENLVSVSSGVIDIVGDDFPFAIQIIPAINKSGSYNFYSTAKNKFINIDFQKRFDNITRLVEVFGEKYLKLCQIFSGIYYNIYRQFPSAIFIESLVANLPDKIYQDEKGGIYQNFVFACNYLVNSKVSEMFAITDPSKKIYEEYLCFISLIEINNFMKDLQKYL